MRLLASFEVARRQVMASDHRASEGIGHQWHRRLVSASKNAALLSVSKITRRSEVVPTEPSRASDSLSPR
jgi:hypothetical protein